MVVQEATNKTLAARGEKAEVSWQGRNITITFDDVKKRLCPRATDQEVIVFLKMAQSLNLNPWARDIYMVKYKDDEPAGYIVANEAYLKAAELCPEYDGHEAGIIIKSPAGELILREGAFLLDEEKNALSGAWAKVYRKDRQRPFYIAVNIKECQKYNREGQPTRFWREMPATMVRKVALSRALREAFPSRLGGLVTAAEYEQMPEGELPEAFVSHGEVDWKKFWGKVKSELGLSVEQARELLQVTSVKEELINQGWSMEQIWGALVNALQQGKPVAGQTEESEDGLSEEKETVTEKEKRDPLTVTTLNELLKACNEDFEMQPKEVYAELNVKSANDIADTPAACYRRIAAVRRQ
ncbi:phage recombination protein Bet [Chloroflexota bacterium]